MEGMMATDVTEMTAGHLAKAVELADRRHSELLDEVIAAGFGSWTGNELRKYGDGPHAELVAEYLVASDRLSDIQSEIFRRQNYHGSLRRIRVAA